MTVPQSPFVEEQITEAEIIVIGKLDTTLLIWKIGQYYITT